tara:strand:- start:300 stop:686 length:387 start_codon:yes stop_codon:yes gene_type:complete
MMPWIYAGCAVTLILFCALLIKIRRQPPALVRFFMSRWYQGVVKRMLVASFVVFIFFLLIIIFIFCHDILSTDQFMELRESQLPLFAFLWSGIIFLMGAILAAPIMVIESARKIKPVDSGVNWKRDGF